MTDGPLVSIVIPAYQARHTIAETIDSALNQTYKPIEIIVVDDGSQDGTGDFIAATYGQQVKLIRQANSGPAIARHRGIQAAQGDYIQFIDADDRLLPEKVAICYDALTARPDAALAYTRYRRIDAAGSPLDEDPPPLVEDDRFCAVLNQGGMPFQTGCMLLRRSAYDAVGGFWEAGRLAAQDWDLILRLAAAFPFVPVDMPLVEYRVQPGSFSGNRLAMLKGRLLAVQRARTLAVEHGCYTAAQYDQVEAGRHHTLAVGAWQAGDMALSRQSWRAALALHPSRMRRLMLLLSYVLPPAWARRYL